MRLKVLLLCFAIALFLPYPVAKAQSPSSGVPQVGPRDVDRLPNILVIITDDWGIEHNALFTIGPADVAIPNITALAEKGMVFEDHWSAPICTPLRVAFHTGRYSFRTLVGWVITVGEDDPFGMKLGEYTIAEMLYAAGYNTAFFSKWHMGVQDDEGGLGAPGVQGYRTWSASEESMQPIDFSYTNWVETKLDGQGRVQAIAHTDYLDEYFARKVGHFISTATEPWFVNWSLILPHAPFDCPPPGLLSEGSCNPVGTNLSRYRNMIDAMDDLVGQVLDLVDLEDTLVFLMMGDNGSPEGVGITSTPCNDTNAKKSVFECGVRNPLIVAGPRVPVGRSKRMIAGLDIYATAASIAGAAAPNAPIIQDSMSFAPLIGWGGPNYFLRDFLYTEAVFPSGPDFPAETWQVAVRDQTGFKFIADYLGPRRLHDLRTDPMEEDPNLLNNPLNTEQIEHCTALVTYLETVWDAARFGEAAPPTSLCD